MFAPDQFFTSVFSLFHQPLNDSLFLFIIRVYLSSSRATFFSSSFAAAPLLPAGCSPFPTSVLKELPLNKPGSSTRRLPASSSKKRSVCNFDILYPLFPQTVLARPPYPKPNPTVPPHNRSFASFHPTPRLTYIIPPLFSIRTPAVFLGPFFQVLLEFRVFRFPLERKSSVPTDSETHSLHLPFPPLCHSVLQAVSSPPHNH